MTQQVKNIDVTPVILCGGSGTRLWPLSRTGFPKQFICLTDRTSLFQQAALRLTALATDEVRVAPPIVVTGEEHRFLTSEQLREVDIPLGSALLEPIGRNTAPALTLAALAALEAGQDTVLAVTPADQTIADAAAFKQAMRQAIKEADKGSITILGITPHRAETGYGYILGEPPEGATELWGVQQFIEKPDAAKAQSYLEAGRYFWNAGIFVLKASVWIQALANFRPDILETVQQAWQARKVDAQFIRPDSALFAAATSESVDYAVIEHCPGSDFSIKMVPLEAGWSDLGAWDAVWQSLPKDTLGNAVVGDVLATDSSNNLVHANSRLVTLVGVNDLVVVETPDAVLITTKDRCQDVKHIVTTLDLQQRTERSLHRKVHRPWGWYDSIDEGERFKVKRIQVKPKASLSLQKHHHRAEHWVVVKGTAEITNGDKVLTLTENQSTYIPLGETHRLTNPGTIPLEIIEVQSGSYLGEDDIVRFEDHYGRTEA
jgi:mannose-1-phosphate guanylyltransferase/mannose-6-phosphate isomerase